jgi:hypothetical protein
MIRCAQLAMIGLLRPSATRRGRPSRSAGFCPSGEPWRNRIGCPLRPPPAVLRPGVNRCGPLAAIRASPRAVGLMARGDLLATIRKLLPEA